MIFHVFLNLFIDCLCFHMFSWFLTKKMLFLKYFRFVNFSIVSNILYWFSRLLSTFMFFIQFKPVFILRCLKQKFMPQHPSVWGYYNSMSFMFFFVVNEWFLHFPYGAHPTWPHNPDEAGVFWWCCFVRFVPPRRPHGHT